jgi:hypothetical protein
VENITVIGTSVYALQFNDLMENLESKIKGADNIDKDSKELREEMKEDILEEIKDLDPVVRDVVRKINDVREDEFHNGDNAYADEPELPDGSKNPEYVPPMDEEDQANLIEDPNHPGEYIIHQKPEETKKEKEEAKPVVTEPSVIETQPTEENIAKEDIILLPGFEYDENGKLKDSEGNEIVIEKNDNNNTNAEENVEPEEVIHLLPGYYYDDKGTLRDADGNEVNILNDTSSLNTNNVLAANNNSTEIELLMNYKKALLASANTIEPEKGKSL